MATDQSSKETEQTVSEERPWDGELGPWPRRKNILLATSLAGVAAAVLATAVTLAMLIHYDKSQLTSFLESLLDV